MTIVDGLIVLGIFGALGWAIWHKLYERDNRITQKTVEWINRKPKQKMENLNEKMQQVYARKDELI